MKEKNLISEEMLNAYVDGELSVDDQAELMEALRKNPKLSEQVCELRVLKEMLTVSYQYPLPTAKSRQDKNNKPSFYYTFSGLAASVVLLFSVALASVIGYQMGYYQPLNNIQSVQLSPANNMQQSVLLHIGTDNHERIQLALDNAEYLLKSFSTRQKNVQLQVLVNAEGIHMLNMQNSPYIARIQAISEEYENVAFLACQRSIERQKLKGVEIYLVKEAKVVEEALQTVVNRLESGWVYIRA